MDDADDVLRRAKHRIAEALVGGGDQAARLGVLTLRPHQTTAVSRLLAILATYRGALLADAVGLGKTYVALAVARHYASASLVCPAALRKMWERVAADAEMKIPIVSIEGLSRGTSLPETDLLVVDEAHHLRTPGTRRYAAVAHMAHRARVLLLSATPLHNSRRDLTALLALFAGSGVRAWSDEALATFIVRRDEAIGSQALPAIDGPHALTPAFDDDCLEAILSLPPTVPAADEGEAPALTTISLLHLWSSSRAALVFSVKKRLARATALRDAAACGRVPTAAELRAWRFADDALQLAFPIFESGPLLVGTDALVRQLDEFIRAARALLASCRDTPNPDEARAGLLRDLRRRHPGARIVAFSQYANTINALAARLRAETGVAVVGANGARIASGAVTRDEVLAQYGGDPASVRAVERIDLVLATDLMSEGIDLRGASVIVHLDLPWNPARLEQRVGRARRLESPHDAIHVYTFLPPAAAERILELRRRLAGKIEVARAIVGAAFDPLGESPAAGASSVQEHEKLRGRLTSWIDAKAGIGDGTPAIAAAASSRRGWVAAVSIDGLARLITAVGNEISNDPSIAAALISDVGHACELDAGRRRDVEGQIRDWLRVQRTSGQTSVSSPAKRAILERLFETVSRAPRHRRAAIFQSAQRARAGLSTVVGVGAERVLSALSRSIDDDEAWLRAVEAFGQAHGARGVEPDRDGLVGLILLEPVSPVGDATPE